MGPHSFKCGKEVGNIYSLWRQYKLQWGRTLSSAESDVGVDAQQGILHTSMGPHSFKCGKLLIGNLSRFPIGGTSMGPHSFKCGKSGSAGDQDKWDKYFNGAALFQVRKVSTLRNLKIRKSNFNGAALFQVRKDFFTSFFANSSSDFNGAALFQVRKESGRRGCHSPAN